MQGECLAPSTSHASARWISDEITRLKIPINIDSDEVKTVDS